MAKQHLDTHLQQLQKLCDQAQELSKAANALCDELTKRINASKKLTRGGKIERRAAPRK